MTDVDPREELRLLAQALRVHAEAYAATGAGGVERASAELMAMRARLAADSTAPGTSDVEQKRHPVSLVAAAKADVASPPDAGPSSTGSSTDAGGDPKRRLVALSERVAGCTQCALHEGRTQTVFARGTGSSGLCFVGEGPGADEDAEGFPFVGKAGQLLDRMISAMGLDRDEVYVCNIVKCRPPKNRKPEADEMAACRPYLAEQIELVNPQVIVALGATAVEGLLGLSGGITRMRGTWRLYSGRIAVMPTFHPAYLLRTPEAKREVWLDLQEVLRHMGRTLPGKT